jgi:hypothetical protein
MDLTRSEDRAKRAKRYSPRESIRARPYSPGDCSDSLLVCFDGALIALAAGVDRLGIFDLPRRLQFLLQPFTSGNIQGNGLIVTREERSDCFANLMLTNRLRSWRRITKS